MCGAVDHVGIDRAVLTQLPVDPQLEAQLTEEENLEIVRMVKAVRMDNKELTAFLKAYASGLITLPDGMMEAEAAADPDDADVEGMEDGEDEA